MIKKSALEEAKKELKKRRSLGMTPLQIRNLLNRLEKASKSTAEVVPYSNGIIQWPTMVTTTTPGPFAARGYSSGDNSNPVTATFVYTFNSFQE